MRRWPRFGITVRYLFAQAAALIVSVLVAVFFNIGITVVIVLNGLILAAAVVDFLRIPGKRCFKAERHMPVSFEQGNSASIELLVTYTDRSINPGSLKIRITDTLPNTFTGGKEVGNYTLKFNDATVTHAYKTVPILRGAFKFGSCFIELGGAWQLSTKRFALDCPGAAQVYPDLTLMRHYRMLAAKNQLAREDTALHKHRGIGMEFVGLREYSPDDDMRKINWKVSARAGKLISNMYDVEKNRNVIIAVDTGYWMQAPMGDVSRLDKALELAAAVMQVALSSGDRAGLLLFDTQSQFYLAPGKGVVHIREFLQALYGARAAGRQPSYAALSTTLLHKLTKRAFICLLTYLDSPEAALEAQVELSPLIKRHSLFVASLADMGLDKLIDTKVSSVTDIYLKAAAAHRRKQELAAIRALNKYGVAGDASEPSELLVRAIRHYLVNRLGTRD